ncbi:MAG TPA: NUDIX hydrolase [Polyangia bacterium]|nr:NUDIX hydrolase [Polyangia bacterium]
MDGPLGEERRPAPTVDVIIEVSGGIVLVQRKFAPRGWALPGGFVDYGELVADAARREAREETGLEVELLHLLGVYSNPLRDARRHTISTAYIGRAVGSPRAGDDALEVAVVAGPPWPELVFDHADILSDYVRFRERGERPPLGR